MTLPLQPDLLLNLAYQRTLGDFESALIRLIDGLNLPGWACIFPPSFDAGGRRIMIAKGVRTTGSGQQLLKELMQGENRPPAEEMLAALAQQLAPAPDAFRRTFSLRSPDQQGDFLFVCFRTGTDFDEADATLLQGMGRNILRCFLLLSQEQEQRFLNGVLHLITNLYQEGICLLDGNLKILLENLRFREHVHRWVHGTRAAALSLPRQSVLPSDWQQAATEALKIYQTAAPRNLSSRLSVTQGPVVRLELEVGRSDFVTGAVRYLAFQSALGMRPYLLLTSAMRKRNLRPSQSLAQTVLVAGLSRREQEIAELLLQGHPTVKIAELLAIAPPTAKIHIRNLLRKAGVRTRLEFLASHNHSE
jgi:DNA-binding CsgD family transcriptional regulator